MMLTGHLGALQASHLWSFCSYVIFYYCPCFEVPLSPLPPPRSHKILWEASHGAQQSAEGQESHRISLAPKG